MSLEMTMLKALMRVRLAALKQAYNVKDGKGKKSRGVLFTVLTLYLAGMLAFVFFSTFSQLADAFYSQGLSWVYFALFATVDLAVMVIGTVFTAKTQLYEAKDNDLLLSMPIPPRFILISRLFVLMVINGFFNIIISASVGVAWFTQCPPDAKTVAAFTVICMALPFFATAISALFGYLLSLLTRRMKNKTAFTVVFSLCFFGAYLFFVNRMPYLVDSACSMGDVFAEKLYPIFILRMIGFAIADGSTGLLAAALMLLVPFVAVFFVLDVTFIKNATTKSAVPKKKYVEKTYRQSNALVAFYKKELRRFSASAAYMLNAGLGALFEVIFGAAIIGKISFLREIAAAKGLPDGFLMPLVLCVLCFMCAMADITAPSVSLEGRAIWIAQSAPVEPCVPLKAKLLLHLTVSGIATLAASICAVIALRPSAAECAVCLILPQLFSLFTGLFGLLINIRFPNLDWDNENQAVKTGLAVFITLFGSIGVAFALTGVTMGLSMLLPVSVASGLMCVVFGVADALMYKRLVTKGAKRFARL